LIVVLTLAVAGPGVTGPRWGLQAQDLQQAALPREVADGVVAFFNDPSTIRLSGESRIPAGREITGDVAVFGGPLSVAGLISGDVVVVNGDVVIEAGGRIAGDLIIVGGELMGAGSRAAVSGGLAVYADRLRLTREGNEVAYAGVVPEQEEAEISGNLGVGSLRFTVRAGKTYNRTEGLPVLFGPVFETTGPNPLSLEMLGLWRTDSGFNLDTDELGYQVRVDQMIGGTQEFSIGAELFDLVEPLETWGLTDLEASLATFLLHTDYRDYVSLRGWSAYLRYRPKDTGFTATLDYRDEDHQFRRVGSPWAFSGNDDPWRPQPLVNEGSNQTLGLRLELDTRNDRRHPSGGWLLDGHIRFGVAGTWVYPGYRDPYTDDPDQDGVEQIPSQSIEPSFSTGFLDVRKYNRVTPSVTLNLRGLLGGTLDGEPLPAQYQHALGGEGSVPGYSLFYGDCKARDTVLGKPIPGEDLPDPAFHQYGCDRIAMFQVEVRQTFFTNLGVGSSSTGWLPVIDLTPGWAVFMNGGRGWASSDLSPAGYERADTETLLDAGLGVFLGSVGVYWAAPLTGDHGGSNFFVRLSHRF
jgi:hypothetical protein